MAVDGTLIFNTKIDESGFKQGVSGLKSSAVSLKGVMGKIGAVVAGAFAVKKLIDFGESAIQLASDVAEVQNVVDTAFGSMKYKMEEFADTAIETYGISKLAAKQTGSTYMSMARSMGLSMDTASNMSVKLAGLSADMASFYNAEQSVTSNALNSVFTGETETLKKYGIVMTEANLAAFAMSQGITKSYRAMTQAEKVQLRYAYVMKQTALAQGDFARTSDSWANQTRILSEQWKEFSATVGDVLSRILLPGIKNLNKALVVLVQLAKYSQDAIYSIFGWQKDENGNKTIEKTADIYNEMADSADDTADAVERQLMGFDKINKLNVTNTKSLGISVNSSVNFDDTSISGILDKTQNDVNNWTTKVKESLEILKSAIKEYAVDILNEFGLSWEEASPLERLGAVILGTLKLLGEWILDSISEWAKNDVDVNTWLDIFGVNWEEASPFERISAIVLGLLTKLGNWLIDETWVGQWLAEKIDVWLDVFGVEWENASPLQFIGALILGLFQGLGTIILKVLGGIGNFIINGFIGLINGAIDLLNLIPGVDIEKIGYLDFGDTLEGINSIVSGELYDYIPGFATGTVVPAHYGEFLGILGDNKKEPEVVSPLSTIKKAVKEALSEGGGGDITIILKVAEDVLYETVVKKHQQKMMQTGVDDFA